MAEVIACRESGDGPSARQESFRAKVALQQFMNQHGPLFRAFALREVPVSEVADGDVLVGPTEAAAALTRLVKSGIEETGREVGAREASLFRGEAAHWVAEKWLRGEDYAVERAAAGIVKAVVHALESDGRGLDHDRFNDERISTDASLMMSAAGVTARLMRQVEIYDFRLGRNDVLKTLLDGVIGKSIEVADEMLPKGAPQSDRINLMQTASRNLSSILEGIYERKARDVTGLLKSKPREFRVEWLARNKPVREIMREFDEWSTCFLAFAVATAQGLSPRDGSRAPAA